MAAVVVYTWTCAEGDLIPSTPYQVTSNGSPANIYDFAGVVSQGSVFTSDGLGRAAIYLPAGVYRLAAQGHQPTDDHAVLSIAVPDSSPGGVFSTHLGLTPSGDSTGATDTTNIQNALNAGGCVLSYATPSNPFWINQTLVVPDGTAGTVGNGFFAGQGDAQSIIKQAAGANITGPLVTTSNFWNSVHTIAPAPVEIRDLGIDVNCAAQSYASMPSSDTIVGPDGLVVLNTGSRVSDVRVYNPARHGIVVPSQDRGGTNVGGNGNDCRFDRVKVDGWALNNTPPNQTGTLTAGSTSITSVGNTTNYQVGMVLVGVGIAINTTLVSKTASTLTMSQAALDNATSSTTVYGMWGQRGFWQSVTGGSFVVTSTLTNGSSTGSSLNISGLTQPIASGASVQVTDATGASQTLTTTSATPLGASTIAITAATWNKATVTNAVAADLTNNAMTDCFLTDFIFRELAGDWACRLDFGGDWHVKGGHTYANAYGGVRIHKSSEGSVTENHWDNCGQIKTSAIGAPQQVASITALTGSSATNVIAVTTSGGLAAPIYPQEWLILRGAGPGGNSLAVRVSGSAIIPAGGTYIPIYSINPTATSSTAIFRPIVGSDVSQNTACHNNFVATTETSTGDYLYYGYADFGSSTVYGSYLGNTIIKSGTASTSSIGEAFAYNESGGGWQVNGTRSTVLSGIPTTRILANGVAVAPFISSGGTGGTIQLVDSGPPGVNGQFASVGLSSGTPFQPNAVWPTLVHIPIVAGNITVTFGPSSGGTDFTMFSSQAMPTGAFSMMVPAGWHVVVTAVTGSLGANYRATVV